MLKRINLKLTLTLMLLLSICFFYSCRDNDTVVPQDTAIQKSAFQKYQEENTQHFQATDSGDGTYEVIGKSGTIIQIANALVNNKAERVRGTVDIKLIEIYTVPEMFMHRKQTLSIEENGRFGILESGGEIFLSVSQNGEELQLDGTGSTRILLPTENTGGFKENMQLYLGELQGEQIIWRPTGERIKVWNSASRNNPHYMIENTLGWVNVDKLNESQGDDVDCIQVIIDCDDLCSPNTIAVGLKVTGENGAFEIPATSPNQFELCGPYPLGGVQVSFIIAIQCPDGSFMVRTVTKLVNSPIHMEIVTCDDLKPMTEGELQQALLMLP